MASMVSSSVMIFVTLAGSSEEDGARLLFHQQSRGRGYFQRLGTAPQRQQGAQQHDEFFHGDPPLLRW